MNRYVIQVHPHNILDTSAHVIAPQCVNLRAIGYLNFSSTARIMVDMNSYTLSRISSDLPQLEQSFRTERDTFGELHVPSDRYWGAQTQRYHQIVSSTLYAVLMFLEFSAEF
jgi:hypothetical protein